MTSRTRESLRGAIVVGTLLCASSCGGAATPGGRDAGPGVEGDVTRRQQIRPTEGDGWHGNGYGDVEVESHPSAGDAVRVWYTAEGEHAVPTTDRDPSDGTPDYVQTVARAVETSHRVLVEESGFRGPVDDRIYHDGENYGGDSRFDVYLQDLEQNDGYRVVEACDPRPVQCAGYVVMENDFRGFPYPSTETGIEVVGSHEYMHAVLDAYTSEFPRFVSEGMATWAEEHVFPSQSDYEAALRAFFRETDRPLPSREAGNPADPFPYGTAVWPTYLAERFGVAFLHDWLVAMANSTITESRDLWDATDQVLAEQGTSLEEAFSKFALWNLLTGDRAGLIDGVGYEQAESFPEVVVPPGSWGARGAWPKRLELSTPHLSAVYRALDLADTEAREFELVATGRLRFAVVAVDQSESVAHESLRPAGGLDRANLQVPATGRLYIVAANVETSGGSRTGELEFRRADDAPDADTGASADRRDVESADAADTGTNSETSEGELRVESAATGSSGGGGCATARGSPTPAGSWFAGLAVALGLLRVRRGASSAAEHGETRDASHGSVQP